MKNSRGTLDYFCWCPREDLNLHEHEAHYPLKVARLPVPPLGHGSPQYITFSPPLQHPPLIPLQEFLLQLELPQQVELFQPLLLQQQL